MSYVVLLFVLLCSSHSIAEDAATTQPAEPLSLEQTSPPKKERKPYPDARGVGAKRVRDRPSYVRSFEPFWDDDQSWDWFEFGLQHRTRYELRDDFFRQNLQSDDYFLMRSRAYLGIKEVLDPFRFGVEFIDARALGNDFPENDRDIDHADILQAFAELYFDDAAGPGQPVSLRFGRMSFDTGDRRLISRNRWPNVPNAFDGFRLRIGDEASLWEVDMFVFQPVQRRLYSLDRSNDDQLFYGVVGYWRQWSPIITLEPYYFFLDENGGLGGISEREVHTVGLRGFGLIGKSGFDYDFNLVHQFGNYDKGNIRAHAAHAELGYTFDHEWTPRVAAMFDYASGDHDPNDRLAERFDPLFGAPHPFFGFSDDFTWQNTLNPALHISLKPNKRLKLNALYRIYWLESDKDAFVRARIIDPTGTSGNYVGQEVDLTAEYQIDQHTAIELGYAHFAPGSFVHSATDSTDDSDFFYMQMTISY